MAHGVELGLELEVESPDDAKQPALKVIGVHPDSAIFAWNKQCVSGPGAGKEIRVGDRIVAVNSASEAEQMLAECKEKHMLKFTVVRGEVDCPIGAGWIGHAEAPSRERNLAAMHRQALAMAHQVSCGPPPPPPLAAAAMAMLAAAAPMPRLVGLPSTLPIHPGGPDATNTAQVVES